MMGFEHVIRGLPQSLVQDGWWLAPPPEAGAGAPPRPADFAGNEGAPDLGRQPGQEAG